MRGVMSKRMKVAFCCHLLAILGLAIVGLIYIFRSEFMPYHAVAVGRNWAEVESAFQVLILALIKTFGGATFSAAQNGHYSFYTIQVWHSMGTLGYSCHRFCS